LLGLLGALASVATVSGFNSLLLGFSSLYFWPTVLAFTLFIIAVILQVFLIKGLGKLTIIAFVTSAAPLALFWNRIYPQISMVLIAGAALFFIFLFFAMKRGHSVAENSIKLKFFDIAKSFVPKVATGFLLLACILLYLNYFEWGNFTPAMGRKIVTGIILSAEPVVKVIVPSVSLGVTIRQLLENIAADQLKNTKLEVPGVSGGPETSFQSLPKLDQKNLIGQATNQLLGVFESRFGVVNPDEKLTDFAYDLISKYANTSLGSSPWILPLAAVLLFFTAMKGILALFYWLFTLLAYLVFKLLVLLGFAYFNLETRSREFILL